MSLRDKFRSTIRDLHVEEVDTKKQERKKQERKNKELSQTSMEDAINKIVKGESWDSIYNQIIDCPSPEGVFPYQFSGELWDTKKFEDYMIKTLPLVNLKNVLAYKSARLLSEKRGYMVNEQQRNKVR